MRSGRHRPRPSISVVRAIALMALAALGLSGEPVHARMRRCPIRAPMTSSPRSDTPNRSPAARPVSPTLTRPIPGKAWLYRDHRTTAAKSITPRSSPGSPSTTAGPCPYLLRRCLPCWCARLRARGCACYRRRVPRPADSSNVRRPESAGYEMAGALKRCATP